MPIEIDENLYRELLEYLGTMPYKDVAQLIGKLARARQTSQVVQPAVVPPKE